MGQGKDEVLAVKDPETAPAADPNVGSAATMTQAAGHAAIKRILHAEEWKGRSLHGPLKESETTRLSENVAGRFPGDSTGIDGSGVWAADAAHRGISDQAMKQAWRIIAKVAREGGLKNAARHLDHYLDNTGDPLLIVEVAELLKAAAVDEQMPAMKAEAELRAFALLPMNGGAGEKALDHGHERSAQTKGGDWFYAIGGFCYHWQSKAVALPTQPGEPSRAQMTLWVCVHDRYDWDSGKNVELAGVCIPDTVLGQLHKRGLAREYELIGRSQPIEWTATQTSPTEIKAEVASTRVGAATQPSRKTYVDELYAAAAAKGESRRQFVERLVAAFALPKAKVIAQLDAADTKGAAMASGEPGFAEVEREQRFWSFVATNMQNAAMVATARAELEALGA